MKKTILIIIIVLLSVCSDTSAQITNLNDSLRSFLSEFLILKQEIEEEDTTFKYAILSKELLTGETLDNQINGVFWFCVGSPHSTFHSLLVNNGNSSIVDPTEPFIKVSRELLTFFNSADWITKDDMIVYFGRAIKQYKANYQ